MDNALAFEENGTGFESQSGHQVWDAVTSN